MSMISEQVRRLREFSKTLKYADEYNLVNGAADTIEELSAKLHNSQMERSSQYYNGGWIPVTERLPEEGELVLVWYEYFRFGDYNCMYQTYGIGYQYNEYWSGDVSGVRAKCLAWMPLPKEYNGGDTDAGSD